MAKLQRSEQLMMVHSVEVMEDYTLRLTFNNGSRRTFDVSVLFDRPLYQALRDTERFRQVSICETGALEWPGDIDIDPEGLYELSIPEQPGTIGERIAAARRRQGKTQQQVADIYAAKVGIDEKSARMQIARWETGKKLPSVLNLEALCEALGCNVGWLITGKAS